MRERRKASASAPDAAPAAIEPLKPSRGNLRASAMYRPSECAGGAAVARPGRCRRLAQPLRRRGLRRRLSLALIVATLGPVIAVVGRRGRADLLQRRAGHRVRGRARPAGGARPVPAGGAGGRGAAPPRSATIPSCCARWARAPDRACAARLGELSDRQPTALLEVTDATGRVVARCARGACDELLTGAGRAALRAGRSLAGRCCARSTTSARVSIESARRSPGGARGAAARRSGAALLGAVVVTVPIDGRCVDRLKARARRRARGDRLPRPRAQLVDVHGGDGRARWSGPRCRTGFDEARAGASAASVAPLEVDGHEYSVAFGQLQDVNAGASACSGVAVDREPLAAARRRASTDAGARARSATLLLAIALADLLARRMTRPLQDLHAGALSIARGDLDTSIAVDSRDEIGDVAEAFRVMTRSLKENQEGLAARVRELVTVHQVGRAVSSVVDLGSGAALGRRREVAQRPRRQDRGHRAGRSRARDAAPRVRGARRGGRAGRRAGWRRLAAAVAALGARRAARRRRGRSAADGGGRRRRADAVR